MEPNVLDPSYAPEIVEHIAHTTYRNALDWELSEEEARYNMWAALEEFFDLDDAHMLFQLTDSVVKRIKEIREALA